MKQQMIFIFSTWLAMLLIFSCEPMDAEDGDPMVTDTTKVQQDSNIVWQFAGEPDSISCLSITPVIFNNSVLFSSQSSRPETFLICDKRTGNILASYTDHDRPDWKSGEIFQYKNYCVIGDWYILYLFDLEKNTFLKKINTRDYGYDANPRFGKLGEWIYLSVEKINHPRRAYTNSWVKYNVLTEEFQEILTIEDQGTFEAGFEPPGFWFKPNGDTVMIFQNRQYDFINRGRRIDMYAYNLTQKKYEWTIDSFTRTGNTSVYPPIIKGDRFYVQAGNEAFCFSCVDGHQIWNQYFPGEGFFLANAILEEGKYIFKSESYKMFAMDENTGDIVWTNAKAGPSQSNMIYHKGRIFYESGQDGHGVLRSIRVADGVVDWTYFSSNYKQFLSASFGLSGIALDPEENVIYSNDRIFHMCVKLPE